MFAGGLFEARARRSWGLDERRAAGVADCEARAAAHGLGPIRWPQAWPTSDILIARAMAFAAREGRLESFALAAMRTAFRHGGELGELATVQRVAEPVGLDPGALARAVTDPSIKAAVRAAHDEAMSLGVFGIPTVVGGAERFWGDDRLLDAAVAARISSSRPSP